MKSDFRFRKRHFIFGGIFLILFFLFFFLSTIVRMWLVDNSIRLIGRKLEIKELHFNYLTVTLKIKNLVLYENNQKDTFLSFSEVKVNYAPWKLFSHEYAFSEILIADPFVSLVYSGRVFNFDDLAGSKVTKPPDSLQHSDHANAVKYLVRNLHIIHGYIHYSDQPANTGLDIKDLGLDIPEISWNSRESKLGVNFTLGKNGKVFISGTIDQTAGRYSVLLNTENIDIQPFTNYMKSYLNIQTMQGMFYSKIKLTGDMTNPENMMISGDAGVKNFLIKDLDGQLFYRAGNMLAKFDTLDTGKSNYMISSLKFDDPQLVAVLERGTTNIQGVLAPFFLNDTTNTTQKTADTTRMHYSIDSMIIHNGNLLFTDLTLNRPFSYNLNGLDVCMTQFSDVSSAIPVNFSMSLNGTGRFTGKTVLNLTNNKNLEFDGSITGLDLMSFSPYTEYYLARPIKRGVFNYSCKLKMNPAKLDNMNNLKIANLEFGKKTKDSTAFNLPVCLALYILKDRNGMVKIDLPVSGKPSDPSFRLGKLIIKTLGEFLLKVCTEPFNALGSMFGSDPASVKSVPFNLLQDSLTNNMRSTMDKIADIITRKQELFFTFTQTTDPIREKRLLALQESKFRFVKSTSASSDSLQIIKQADQISSGDPMFLAFIGFKNVQPQEDTIQVKCLKIEGIEKIKAIHLRLLKKREMMILDYMNTKGLPPGSFSVNTADLHNLPQQLRVPQFKVELSVK